MMQIFFQDGTPVSIHIWLCEKRISIMSDRVGVNLNGLPLEMYTNLLCICVYDNTTLWMSPLIIPDRCTVKYLHFTRLKSGLSWSGFHIIVQQTSQGNMFVKIHFILVFQIEITFGEVRLHWPWCVKSCESYCCYKSLLSLFAVPITGTVSVQKHVLKAKQLLVSTGFTNTKAG